MWKMKDGGVAAVLTVGRAALLLAGNTVPTVWVGVVTQTWLDAELKGVSGYGRARARARVRAGGREAYLIHPNHIWPWCQLSTLVAQSQGGFVCTTWQV